MEMEGREVSVVYLDHAATSFPKAPGVAEAITAFLTHRAGNPGRSGHALAPVAEATKLAHHHGALVLLDAAQTAGALPIDVAALGVDLLAFPGHKGLLGPTGVGGLYVAPGLRLTALKQGGTGPRSEEVRQPEELPEALEAGTLNTVGLAGLGAAIRYLRERGVEAIRAHETQLTLALLEDRSRRDGAGLGGAVLDAR